MARAIADRLGVPVRYVTYPRPGELADAAGTGAWDIGLIGAEPQRAEKIAFTAAYCEIEATYLVPAGSPIKSIAEVDRAGRAHRGHRPRRLRPLARAQHPATPTLVRSDTLDGAFEQFVDDKLEALAGLRPRLLTDAETLPGSRILDGQFTAVQQADRHGARQRGRRRRSCATSSRRRRPRASWRA